MDLYLMATFKGTDGDHGYVSGDQFELQVYLSKGTIKIYEPPDNSGEWMFNDLYSFLQSWTYVSLVE